MFRGDDLSLFNQPMADKAVFLSCHAPVFRPCNLVLCDNAPV